jgi:hypothetical protein
MSENHEVLHYDAQSSSGYHNTWTFDVEFITSYYMFRGHTLAQLVETLRYKPEGRGFDWHNPSGRTMALGSTQPQQKESQGYFLGIKAAGT